MIRWSIPLYFSSVYLICIKCTIVCINITGNFCFLDFNKYWQSVWNKAGTHWPNHWMSEPFRETRTSLGTNLFGVFCCIRSFWNRVEDVVCLDSTCEVWEGWLLAIGAILSSDWLCASCMTILIGSVLANQRSACGGAENCVRFVFLCTPFHDFLFSCFGVLARD